jgi:regulator of cell morphogenesis and NO signaling
MNFTSETKVKDITLADPSARHVLEDARVDYCCGGGKSLQEACVHAGVDAQEILKQLRENSQHVDPSEANWTASPLSDLTAHIKNHHHQYVREAILRINPLLEKVKAKHGEQHPELAEIETSFHAVGREMILHMQKEEKILFPFIEALDRAANGIGTLEPPFFQTIRNPIHAMMKEHDAAGDLVKQIREASTEYAAPEVACTSYKALFQELREFERDLQQHVHLENNILFPRAVELEAAVL